MTLPSQKYPERQYLGEMTAMEFSAARRVWGKEKEEILAERLPKWFGKKEAGGLFGSKMGSGR